LHIIVRLQALSLSFGSERIVLRAALSWPKEQVSRFLEGIGQATHGDEHTDEQVPIAVERRGYHQIACLRRSFHQIEYLFRPYILAECRLRVLWIFLLAQSPHMGLVFCLVVFLAFFRVMFS
jgi:hypothetical protein